MDSTNTRRVTPWGRADFQYIFAPGFAWVNTPGHGGFLIGRRVAKKLLSQAAIDAGVSFGPFLAYEEDCDAAVIILERLWQVAPLFLKPKPELLANVLESLARWHPTYVAASADLIRDIRAAYGIAETPCTP